MPLSTSLPLAAPPPAPTGADAALTTSLNSQDAAATPLTLPVMKVTHQNLSSSVGVAPCAAAQLTPVPAIPPTQPTPSPSPPAQAPSTPASSTQLAATSPGRTPQQLPAHGPHAKPPTPTEADATVLPASLTAAPLTLPVTEVTHQKFGSLVVAALVEDTTSSTVATHVYLGQPGCDGPYSRYHSWFYCQRHPSPNPLDCRPFPPQGHDHPYRCEVCAEPVGERHTLGCLHCPPESGYTCFPCILDIVEPHAEDITAQLLERDGDQKTCMLEHTPDDETCSTCVYNGRPTLMCNVLRMLHEGVEEFSQLL